MSDSELNHNCTQTLYIVAPATWWRESFTCAVLVIGMAPEAVSCQLSALRRERCMFAKQRLLCSFPFDFERTWILVHVSSSRGNPKQFLEWSQRIKAWNSKQHWKMPRISHWFYCGPAEMFHAMLCTQDNLDNLQSSETLHWFICFSVKNCCSCGDQLVCSTVNPSAATYLFLPVRI